MFYHILLSFVSFVLCPCSDPRIQARALGSGIQEVVNAVIPDVLRNVKDMPIEDYSGTAKVDVVGDIDFWLNEMTVSDVPTFNKLSTALSGSIGATVDDLALPVKLKWRFKKKAFPFWPSGDGTAIVSISNSVIATEIDTATDDDGGLDLKIKSVDVKLNAMSIKLSNSNWAWLGNLLEKVMIKSIKPNLETKLQAEMLAQLPRVLDEVVGQVPTSIPLLDDRILLMTPLSCAPSYPQNPESIQVGVAGDFIAADQTETPCDEKLCQHADFSQDTRTFDRMARIWVGLGSINSFFDAAQKAGVMKVALDIADNSNTIPPELAIFFKTWTWQTMIPDLFTKYPDRDLRFKAWTKVAPTISLDPAKQLARVNIVGEIEFIVKSENSSDPIDDQSLFTMVLDGHMELSASFTPKDAALSVFVRFAKMAGSQTSFFPTIEAGEFKASLGTSKIGPVGMDDMNKMLPNLFQLVLENANKAFEAGIVIPEVRGGFVTGADLTLQKDFLSVDLDVDYKLPADIHISLQHALVDHRAMFKMHEIDCGHHDLTTTPDFDEHVPEIESVPTPPTRKAKISGAEETRRARILEGIAKFLRI